MLNTLSHYKPPSYYENNKKKLSTSAAAHNSQRNPLGINDHKYIHVLQFVEKITQLLFTQ